MEENIKKEKIEIEKLCTGIEAVLFWKGEPITIKKLAQIFGKTEEEISVALNSLETKISDRGIIIVRKEDEITLGTSKDTGDIIEKLTKEELVKDLGKAGLETLSIIIYQGPISRAEVDYIRGVQSTFILRNLMIRGLIEKVINPKDQRSFLYKPSFELLSYMGISKIEDIPEFAEAKKAIEDFKNAELPKEADEVKTENQNEEIEENKNNEAL
jgi:segregation and condensation protein B